MPQASLNDVWGCVRVCSGFLDVTEIDGEQDTGNAHAEEVTGAMCGQKDSDRPCFNQKASTFSPDKARMQMENFLKDELEKDNIFEQKKEAPSRK